ncbi:MAG: hydantoinase/oxoprolinase N-terminal domain-containing protein [Desulfovibrionaceae bacterium]
MSETRYIIGVDTGGTYTDAVLLDTATGRVLGSAKRPTTHHDLSVGISQALQAVIEATTVAPADVGTVAVSTTLATNTVVEGRGARVGLIMIGHDKPMTDLPIVDCWHVEGGHTIMGEEFKPLDVGSLLNGIQGFKGHVDAYAVSSLMSFVNPAHELVAAKAIELTDPRPVFCSHQASSRAGVKERAATAALNARLMPVMRDFLDSVRASLAALGFSGQVAVVGGDATATDIGGAVEKAAATVASGPAATACFGAVTALHRNAIVVDVGGTTTDVTLIMDGRPTIKESGNVIGDWETHVRAVEMFTVGVGGDSHVRLSGQRLVVGPSRVQPLCLAPDAPPPSAWLGGGVDAKCIVPSPALTPEQAAADPMLAFLVANGPTPPSRLKEHLVMPDVTLEMRLADAIRRQQISVAGFTPTDALHALGALHFGDQDIAQRAARVLADAMGLAVDAFCEKVLDAARDIIEKAILRQVLYCELGHSLGGILDSMHTFRHLKVRITTALPIIGIGAASRHLLPQVAERLDTTIVFPEYYAVGNAVGAAHIAAGALA